MEEEIIKKLNLIISLLSGQALAVSDVMTVDEVAIFLNFSKSHIYKLTSTKQIPHSCPSGKKIYFSKSEIEFWLLSKKKPTFDETINQASKC